MLEWSWSLSLYHWVEHEFPTKLEAAFKWRIKFFPEDWPNFEDPVFKI